MGARTAENGHDNERPVPMERANASTMRATVLLLVGSLAACAGGTPPSAAPSSSDSRAAGVAASQPSNDPARALTKGECESLGRWLADACATRPNERSARVDGWCSDVLRGVSDGSWVRGECLKNIKYMDSVCFQSAANVHNMMACDDSVARQ